MSDSLATPSIPRASGKLTRQAYARATADGLAVEPLLRQAGITREQILDSKVRLPVRSQIVFVDSIADALHDDLLGFHLAQSLELREIGLLYYVIASSKCVMEALRRAVRYSSIVNEGFALRCIETRGVGLSAVQWIGPDRHQSEYLLTTLVRTCRAVTGQVLRPSRVRFVHFRKAISAEFPSMLGDDIEFGADTDDIVFSEHVRDLPVISADPYLNRLLLGYCDEALALRRKPSQSFRTRVESAIAPLLPHGTIATDRLARSLGVSRRTFARRLASEGITFRELLEEMRQDLASRHLADRDLSISQIAWLLGYQDVGAFSHAFRRWTGKSPRAARAAVRPGIFAHGRCA